MTNSNITDLISVIPWVEDNAPDYKTWIKKGSWTLSEAAFLLNGHKPMLMSLSRDKPSETHIFLRACKLSHKLTPDTPIFSDLLGDMLEHYDLIKRHIFSGGLQARHQEGEFWVKPSALFDLCAKIGIALPSELKNVLSLDKDSATKDSCKREKQTTITNQQRQEQKTNILCQKAKKIYFNILAVRRNALCLALDMLYPEKKETDHYDLIQKLHDLPVDEFVGHTTSRKAPKLTQQHRCRVISKLLKSLDNSLSIEDLFTENAITEIGFGGKEAPAPGTFRGWLYKEGIYDRKPQNKSS
jgi:hypothetical protein